MTILGAAKSQASQIQELVQSVQAKIVYIERRASQLPPKKVSFLAP